MTSRRALQIVGVSVGLALALVGWGAGPAGAAEIGPEDDFCGAVNQLQPGDELRLRPGDYQGPCVIRRGGAPGAPTTIAAADPQQRPRILYDGITANVLEVRAGHLVIRGLEFGPTRPDVDAIRIMLGNGLVIENCRFVQVGGIAITANNMSVQGLTIRGNVIEGSRSTGMYFGCHDGQRCVVSDLLVAGNLIRGVTAAPDQVGYGIEIKLNSSGIVRDNIILRTKGPGIMVYGARDLLTQNLVERNVVMGSERAAGIVVGGGPAVVRNNVVLTNNDGGISLQDYGKRGLLRRIVIVHNTIYGNLVGGITIEGQEARETTVLNNAIQSPGGTPAVAAPRPGVWTAGNVDCTYRACFMQPDGFDFSPFPGSALVGPGTLAGGEALPREDLFRMRRGSPPTVGAIERPSGPIPLEPW
ncbi:MAG TPA: right-handed parallel beta-helix repeat-containing protein [Candidatus Dormibacteraeota bacterium]|nr:right-handed parallel beta-helix repeat-containing protein [Candidatus Dormibacteraeota bacterium]